MAETLIRHYVYGSVLFVLFILGGLYIIGDIIDDVPDAVDQGSLEKFNRTFNNFNNINASLGATRDSITGSELDIGSFGTGSLGAFVNIAWQIVKGFFSVFGFMNDVFDGLESYFGIPYFVPLILSLLVIALFIFTLISIAVNKDV